jgi:phage terminase large subunit GpA-like protein
VFSDGLRPPPDQTISEWADANRVLAAKSAAEPGPWRTARTPYLRAPTDAMGPFSNAEMIVLMFGAQTGKTEASINVLGYLMAIEPGPMMLVSPTVDLAKRLSRQRIEPLIAESRVLRNLVAKSRARDEFSTMLQKDFPNGILLLTGANSATGLRSMPARVIFFDEVDAFPPDVDNEGSPIELALKRQSTFADRKQDLGGQHADQQRREPDRKPVPVVESVPLLRTVSALRAPAGAGLGAIEMDRR